MVETGQRRLLKIDNHSSSTPHIVIGSNPIIKRESVDTKSSVKEETKAPEKPQPVAVSTAPISVAPAQPGELQISDDEEDEDEKKAKKAEEEEKKTKKTKEIKRHKIGSKAT